MALPASIRPAFDGLERNRVLRHAGALKAFVRSALLSLVLQPGDRKSLAAVIHAPIPAKRGTLRVFGGGIGYDLCELDVSAVPDDGRSIGLRARGSRHPLGRVQSRDILIRDGACASQRGQISFDNED